MRGSRSTRSSPWRRFRRPRPNSRAAEAQILRELSFGPIAGIRSDIRRVAQLPPWALSLGDGAEGGQLNPSHCRLADLARCCAEGDVNTLRRILQENTVLVFLAALGGISGAKDLLNLFVPGNIGIYLILIVFIAIAAHGLANERRIRSLSPLPTERGIFKPFRTRKDSDGFDIWPRTEEAAELVSRIEQAKESHLVVSGPSGAGKSILVHKLVVPLIKDRFAERPFNTYDGVIQAIIAREEGDEAYLLEQRALLRRVSNFLSSRKCSVRDVLEPGFMAANPDAVALWEEIEAHLSRAFALTPRCYIFDQIERYLHVIEVETEKNTGRMNGFDLFLFARFIGFCREQPECRTIFVIRADHLYASMDFLESIASLPARNGHLRYFLCPGINAKTSAQGVRRIRDDFAKLDLGPENTLNFDEICGLDSRTYANTFRTQIVGFVIEHFFRSDHRVREFLANRKDRSLALRYYFDHFLNDYVRDAIGPEALDTMRVALVTIAMETRATGLPASIERVAALSHMPRDLLEPAVAFAVKAGVLTEEINGDLPAYRFIHDVVSEHVLGNEQFAINATLRHSIQGLSETHVPTGRLTKVARYANVITDLWKHPNFGAVCVWALFVFGALKLRFPAVCEWSSEQLAWAPYARECAFVTPYYLPIYFMHGVWMAFIYHMDRDFLRYTLRSRALRAISASMPFVGMALAIGVSQSPALLIIPIVVCGIMMGILLIAGALDGSFVGRDAQESVLWGSLSVINMLFVSVITPMSVLVLSSAPEARAFWDYTGRSASSLIGAGGDREIVYLAWIYLVCLVMIYFWFHISKDQQARLAYAARLASCDRAQSEQHV